MNSWSEPTCWSLTAFWVLPPAATSPEGYSSPLSPVFYFQIMDGYPGGLKSSELRLCTVGSCLFLSGGRVIFYAVEC